MRFLGLLFALCCLLPTQHSHAQSSSVDFYFHYLSGDFDGDNHLDGLKLSADPNFPSVLISGLSVLDRESSQSVSYDRANESLVVGDFYNDGKDEILVLNQGLEGHYLERDDSGSLVTTGWGDSDRAAKGAARRTLGQIRGTEACDIVVNAAVQQSVERPCENDISAVSVTQSSPDNALQLHTLSEPKLARRTLSSASGSSPSVPTNFRTTPDENDITLTWDTASGATFYYQHVSINGGAWQSRKTYHPPQTSRTFYDLEPATYRYRIRACNGVGCSPFAESATITINAPLPIPGPHAEPPGVYNGAYHPINATFSVSAKPITAATYYEFSYNTSTTSTGPWTQSTTFNTSSPARYIYVRFRGCNASGCGQPSPYKEVYIYQSPNSAVNFTASRTEINLDSGIALRWYGAPGIIHSGYYDIDVRRPGTTVYSDVSEYQSLNKSYYSKGTNDRDNIGTYTYRIMACNPGFPCSPPQFVNVTVQNRDPTAANDNASVDEGQPILIEVLDNDSDPDGHTLTITSTNPEATMGIATCTQSNCTFTATENISSDIQGSFTYIVSDGNGGISEATVSIDIAALPVAPTPTISPESGEFSGTQTVTLSSEITGATIHYTTDGTEPDETSDIYVNPITLDDSTTVKAFAAIDGYEDSPIATKEFTKVIAPPSRRVVFIHTDLLGSPAAETSDNGNGQ